MKTKILIAILVSFLVISVALTAELIAGNGKGKGKEKAPDLEKIEFIHWKKGFGRPPCNNNGICEPELGEKGNCADCKNGEEPPPTATCYAFMGQYGKRLLKWKTLPVTYVINPTDSGLLETFVTTTISAGAEEWDFYAGPELFGTPENGSVSYRVSDNKNAICFGDYYSDPGIIAACTVWYSPATKEIVEFDIIFETDYTWGDASVDSALMDLQNIATHELGHAVGLADVYEDTCSDVTMYGYSSEGETKKRTLEESDVAGILELYP